ncbi:hypothetical protein RDI58_017879 [Solanum bulbocastanum]|uniref:Uncharacterized protein n=1 Tax=Solanum bulbocastanum TaxID=147425 RepID=A0AAN8TAL4_SOLBU
MLKRATSVEVLISGAQEQLLIWLLLSMSGQKIVQPIPLLTYLFPLRPQFCELYYSHL